MHQNLPEIPPTSAPPSTTPLSYNIGNSSPDTKTSLPLHAFQAKFTWIPTIVYTTPETTGTGFDNGAGNGNVHVADEVLRHETRFVTITKTVTLDETEDPRITSGPGGYELPCSMPTDPSMHSSHENSDTTVISTSTDVITLTLSEVDQEPQGTDSGQPTAHQTQTPWTNGLRLNGSYARPLQTPPSPAGVPYKQLSGADSWNSTKRSVRFQEPGVSSSAYPQPHSQEIVGRQMDTFGTATIKGNPWITVFGGKTVNKRAIPTPTGELTKRLMDDCPFRSRLTHKQSNTLPLALSRR